jgi:hypothetical protein
MHRVAVEHRVELVYRYGPIRVRERLAVCAEEQVAPPIPAGDVVVQLPHLLTRHVRYDGKVHLEQPTDARAADDIALRVTPRPTLAAPGVAIELRDLVDDFAGQHSVDQPEQFGICGVCLIDLLPLVGHRETVGVTDYRLKHPIFRYGPDDV